MVSDMVMRDVVQEESSEWTKQRSINRRNCATEECPGILSEVGHRRIRMMQECEHDDPMIGEKVGDEV